ncbi:bacillopeptidase F [Hazenella coriacea]|uniref:Bacillopeptidase F n=2 Tax=Hazenella coriacea TaxID=1179467 RepID=A0A4R3L8Q4_9BACL|nr:bacillopeptidase F [Hazenella coriacea]
MRMQRTQRITMRLFSLLLCFMLVSLGFLPQTANAQVGSENVSMKQTMPVKDKINKRVLDQFAKDQNVTFLVKLKDQADTMKVAKETAQKAKSQKQSLAKTQLMQRSAVVSELRSTAIDTQAHLKDYLTKQKKAGKVKEFESFYIVNGMAVTGTKEVAEAIAAFPEVEKVLPNEKRQLHAPNKVNAKATSKAGTNAIEWNIERVGAPQTWNLGIDGTGTVIGSIDTGVQWDHPALKEKYRGFDPANPNQPDHEFNWLDATSRGQATPYDDNGHGTHTVGTMVGAEPDGANQVGVAPGAKWIAVKAFTGSGSATDQSLLTAGEWMIAPKDRNGVPHPEKAPDVINNSWGGGSGIDDWYRDMVRNWRAANIFPEFSAGNSGPGAGSVNTPSNYPESFATGATDINNKIASFSSRGPSPYGGILKPEVSAPGVNIRSSVPGNGYDGTYSGTSMAGPHVSAVVALLREANPSLTVDEIEQILKETATPLTDSTYPSSPNMGYGYGLVNAFDAVSSVLTGRGKVKGSVMKEGQDNEAPTYQHEAPAETYAGMDLPLSVSVQDNVSIKKVELQYLSNSGEWVAVNASRVEGDYRSGVYQAKIPGNAIHVPKASYKWNIVDYGNHVITSDIYEVNVVPGISVGYSQNFESTPVGWYSFGTLDSWQWGKPTSGPGSAFSGEKVYATNLAGDYDSKADMTLVMPPVDLPEGNAYLQFKQWYDFETRYDFGHVVVSTDQQNWTQLAQVNGLSNGWVDGQVDLSAYAGQRVYLGFHVKTDISIVKKGWYIDDVKLSATALSNITKAPVAKADATSGSGKEQVDPKKLKPSKKINVKYPVAINQVKKASTPSGLPLQATVSVLETGRSATTNPADGSYEINHASGSYTLRAETYGYRAVDQRVEIPTDGVADTNFVLQPIPKGNIKGTVTNKQTGQPIADAKLLLMEDAAIQPVTTDANGNFTLQAYEGTYTLRIQANSYVTQDVQVTVTGNSDANKNIQLKPFIGYSGEIGYDDGTPENARAFNQGGNGWAVKMSLAPGHDNALVTGGLFRFWTNEWPNPGGTEMQVAIYDANGPNGAPGKKLAGPISATAKRDGEWTHVDLRDQGVMVNGDFYMTYIQPKAHPNAPGLATDEDGTNANRSWQFVSGAWAQSPKDEGNYMIRALVDYEAFTPTIKSPTDGLYTNKSEVKVEGTSAPGVNVSVMNNGKVVATVEPTAQGTYSANITLNKGENTLTVKSTTDKGSTDPSDPVKVILDQTAPTISIDKPVNHFKTNQQAVTIVGQASDQYLHEVVVNGAKAKLNADGTYSHRMLLENGENVIKVVAKDRAGNAAETQVKVLAKFDAPEITNLKPDQDLHLKKGNSVKIELDSEAGLEASFSIKMPLFGPSKAAPTNFTDFPLLDTGNGHYVGYWTVPSHLKNIEGAVVEVTLKDDYGNVTKKEAVGKLFIK